MDQKIEIFGLDFLFFCVLCFVFLADVIQWVLEAAVSDDFEVEVGSG